MPLLGMRPGFLFSETVCGLAVERRALMPKRGLFMEIPHAEAWASYPELGKGGRHACPVLKAPLDDTASPCMRFSLARASRLKYHERPRYREAAMAAQKTFVQPQRSPRMKLTPLVLVAALCLTAASVRAQTVTDAQIASIVVTANQVDIDAGKLAESKASKAEVKKFAQQMVTDHTGVNKQATDLVTALKVTPQDNPTSQSLKAGGAQNVAALKKLSGAAFDKAYIDYEVTYHELVLKAVDETLIPNAQNAELKALLVKGRPLFAAHLEHAKRIQAALGK
jgi:putative membrane protein